MTGCVRRSSSGASSRKAYGRAFSAWAANGEGAVRLLGFDGNRMLLEHAGERHLLDDLNTYGDSAATEIAAEAMARLFAPSDRPVPGDLQPLRERFASLFKRAEGDRAAGEHERRPRETLTAHSAAPPPQDATRDSGVGHGDVNPWVASMA